MLERNKRARRKYAQNKDQRAVSILKDNWAETYAH